MIHKLLAGKGRMKKVVSLLLCLALLGSSVISTNVSAAEADTDVTAETAGTTEDETDDTVTVEETTDAEEQIVAAAETGETTAESAAETTTEEVTDTTSAESTSPAVTLTGSYDGVDVTVKAPEGAFTEGVTMVVSEADVEAFADAVVTDCVALDGGTYTVYDAAAVEISFYGANGAEVQPATEVEVTLGNLDLNTGDNDLTKYAIIYHMDDNGNMEYIADGTPGESSYTFSASSFSTYGLIIASVEYGTSENTISGDTTTVAVGSSITLTSNEGGNMSQDHSWSYTSNNGGAVSISTSNNGKTATVTGTSEGTVTITHTYKNGPNDSEHTETYTITVSASGSSSSSGTTYYHIDVRLGGTFTATVTNTTEDKVDVTVTKVWDVEEGTELPESITVYLKDSEGNIKQTATLTSDSADENGNWIYTWEDLELDAGTYTVTEEVPDGYMASYTDQSFIITDSSDSTSSSTVTYTGTVTITSLSSVTIHYSNGDTQTVSVSSGGTDTSGASEYQSAHQNFQVTLSDDDYIELVVSYTYVYYDSEGNELGKDTVTNASVIVYTTYENNVCTSKDATGDMRGFDLEISGSQLLESANIITTEEECTITNTIATTSVTVEKVVTGNMGDTTKEFSFTLTDENGNDLTDNNGFTLSSGEYTTISGITIGSTIILSEDSDGYDMSVECSGGTVTKNEEGSYSIVVTSSSGVTITVTNDKDVDPDTGIDFDTAPYIAILFGVALFSTATLIRRRRRLL